MPFANLAENNTHRIWKSVDTEREGGEVVHKILMYNC